MQNTARFQFKLLKLTACLVLCFLLSIASAFAEVQSAALKLAVESQASDVEKLDTISRQILKKEIEFDSLNQRFRLKTALTTQWRQRRLFLYSETNSCLTESSQIVALPERFKAAAAKTVAESASLRNKDRGKFACAAELQLTGQSASIAGDVFEMGLNYSHYLRLKNDGFDPKSYRQKAEVLERELDALILIREQMLKNELSLAAEDLKIAQLEGQLLNDYRNILLSGYVEYHAATKRFWVLQNTSFLVDLAKNGSGAAGNLIGLTGNHWRRQRMQGGNGVMSIITGVIVMATPAVGRITSNVSAVAARHTVSKHMQNVIATDASVLSQHRSQFLQALTENGANMRPLAGVKENKSAITTYTNAAARRVNVFEKEEKMLYDIQSSATAERKRAHDNLVENVVFAGVVGPPRIANGVTQVVAGWRYYGNRPKANKILAGGSTAYLAATSANIFETGRIQFNSELRFHRQSQSHTLPKDRLEKRLSALKTMDEPI